MPPTPHQQRPLVYSIYSLQYQASVTDSRGVLGHGTIRIIALNFASGASKFSRSEASWMREAIDDSACGGRIHFRIVGFSQKPEERVGAACKL
jgi:hypothetical protein